jgi:hypothetical protein
MASYAVLCPFFAATGGGGKDRFPRGQAPLTLGRSALGKRIAQTARDGSI